MNYDKIFLIASIWYIGWFILSIICAAINVNRPSIRIGGFDLLGSNVITFIPAVVYLLWKYI